MSKRTIQYTVAADGSIDITIPQYAGVAGEHEATRLVFTGHTGGFYMDGGVMRLHMTLGDGAVVSSDLLSIQIDTAIGRWSVGCALPRMATVAGGQLAVRLVCSLLENGEETVTAMTDEAVLYFEDAVIENGTPFWTGVSQLLSSTTAASKQAAQSADDAASQAEVAAKGADRAGAYAETAMNHAASASSYAVQADAAKAIALGAAVDANDAKENALAYADNAADSAARAEIALTKGHPLCGKTAVFDGDSICAASTDKPDLLGAYAGRIATAYGMTVHNEAVGGGTITAETYASDGTTAKHWISRHIDTIYEQYPTLDYLILEGGTNDADIIGFITGDTVPDRFGSYDEEDYSGVYDDTTFCGAVETLFYKALSYYPNAVIGVIIPMRMGTDTTYTPNRRAYFDVLIKLCRKWAIPYLDLWRTSQMNPSLPVYYDASLSVADNTASRYYQDAQHPTSKGYDLLAPKIAAWMANITAGNEIIEDEDTSGDNGSDTTAYTNLVPTAVDADGVTVFNGVGYQNGYYLSSSVWTNLSADSTCVATGYIPYALKDDGTAPVIYVKGVTVSTASHCRMATFLQTDGAMSPMTGVYGTSGTYAWGNIFAFEQLGDQYYKITCLNTSSVRSHVRFSFIGTGDDLIVTRDEPIA